MAKTIPGMLVKTVVLVVLEVRWTPFSLPKRISFFSLIIPVVFQSTRKYWRDHFSVQSVRKASIHTWDNLKLHTSKRNLSNVVHVVSHKTTLLASKRIHTGQNSYTCKRNCSYHQSSTYPPSPEALAQASFKWQSCPRESQKETESERFFFFPFYNPL